MLKTALFTLLLAPLLFMACKKGGDDNPLNQFEITGVHDMNFGTTGGNILALSIEQTSGTAEQITLSVTGLPAGIQAAITPASGTPDFSSTVTFTMNGSVTAGTYPVKIVGSNASASFSKSYDLNIIVPALNGWSIDNLVYRQSNMTHGSFSGFGYVTITSSDNGGSLLTASMNGLFPTADGTYTYKLVELPSASDEIGISTIGGGDYTFTGNDNHTGTLKITGGKYSLNFPATEVTDGTTTKMLTVVATEP